MCIRGPGFESQFVTSCVSLDMLLHLLSLRYLTCKFNNTYLMELLSWFSALMCMTWSLYTRKQYEILYLWTEITVHILYSLHTQFVPKTCRVFFFFFFKSESKCGTRMGVVPFLVSKVHCEIPNCGINSWCFCLFLCFWIPDGHTMGRDTAFLAHILLFRCASMSLDISITGLSVYHG